MNRFTPPLFVAALVVTAVVLGRDNSAAAPLALGAGPSSGRPVASSRTEPGRTRNRGMEIHVRRG